MNKQLGHAFKAEKKKIKQTNKRNQRMLQAKRSEL